MGFAPREPRRGGGLGPMGGGGSEVRIASMEPHRAGTPCGDCGCTGGAPQGWGGGSDWGALLEPIGMLGGGLQ